MYVFRFGRDISTRSQKKLVAAAFIIFIYIYDPGFRVRGPPPPPNGLGPPRRRERSSRLVCVEASQHALHVYIHTHRLYIHTYILTDKYIHTPIHACTYRHAPPTHRGAGHTIDTHIHTYIQIHTYIHTCMYIQTRPPNPQGGAGGRPLVPPTYKNLCTQTLWGGVGGGACSPGPYIYIEEDSKHCPYLGSSRFIVFVAWQSHVDGLVSAECSVWAGAVPSRTFGNKTVLDCRVRIGAAEKPMCVVKVR